MSSYTKKFLCISKNISDIFDIGFVCQKYEIFDIKFLKHESNIYKMVRHNKIVAGNTDYTINGMKITKGDFIKSSRKLHALQKIQYHLTNSHGYSCIVDKYSDLNIFMTLHTFDSKNRCEDYVPYSFERYEKSNDENYSELSLWKQLNPNMTDYEWKKKTTLLKRTINMLSNTVGEIL